MLTESNYSKTESNNVIIQSSALFYIPQNVYKLAFYILFENVNLVSKTFCSLVFFYRLFCYFSLVIILGMHSKPCFFPHFVCLFFDRSFLIFCKLAKYLQHNFNQFMPTCKWLNGFLSLGKISFLWLVSQQNRVNQSGKQLPGQIHNHPKVQLNHNIVLFDLGCCVNLASQFVIHQ